MSESLVYQDAIDVVQEIHLMGYEQYGLAFQSSSYTFLQKHHKKKNQLVYHFKVNNNNTSRVLRSFITLNISEPV